MFIKQKHAPYSMWAILVVIVQLPSHIPLFSTPWAAACQAFPSLTISWNLPKFLSTESVMPANHLILCHPILLLPSIFSSNKVFSSESAVCIRWPKYWSHAYMIEKPMFIVYLKFDCKWVSYILGPSGFSPWVGKIPWRRKWQPTPGIWPGESHGQRSSVVYSPGTTRSWT